MSHSVVQICVRCVGESRIAGLQWRDGRGIVDGGRRACGEVREVMSGKELFVWSCFLVGFNAPKKSKK